VRLGVTARHDHPVGRGIRSGRPHDAATAGARSVRTVAGVSRRLAAAALTVVRDGAERARATLAGPPPAEAAASSYARWWVPASLQVAAAQIFNTTDMSSFEEGGRIDADWLLPHLPPRSTVLDLGCGIGRVAYYVAPSAETLWAVDVSPRMLELARDRLGAFDNVRYALCRDVVVPDVPTGSVDAAYSLLVLQHVEREDAFLLLEELRRMLRQGGLAMLTFPNLLSETYLKGFVDYAHERASQQLNRARIYTPQEVERLLGAAGFEVVELDAATEIRVTARRA
jgi:SAM-dependent methyltransferase